MSEWTVRINGWTWNIKAVNSWTAVTRAIKGYQKMKRDLGLKPKFFKMDINVEVTKK